MNNFYNQPNFLLWLEAILLMIIGFSPTFILVEAGYVQPIYYLLFLIYLPILQFSFTPIFKLSGIYTYYSPMLLGYMANEKQIDLHSGGSFDFLFVMRRFNVGAETRNRILLYHLEGMLNIISLIEENKVPSSVNIVGTSYFFNDRTINKLGFEQEKPSILYRINLMANFIDLIWMYSIARGKFSIPKIWSAKKVKINGSKLVDKKEVIMELSERMSRRHKNDT